MTKLYDAQVLDKAEAAVKAAVPTSATEDFALPTSAAGVSIAWKSDNAAITRLTTLPARPQSLVRPQPQLMPGDPHRHVWQQRQNRRLHGLSYRQLSDAEQAKADLDAVTIEDSDDIRSNFSVPTKGNNGSTISWEVTVDRISPH